MKYHPFYCKCGEFMGIHKPEGDIYTMCCLPCNSFFTVAFRTHPGTFHADDVFSAALLSIIFNDGQQLPIHRGVTPVADVELVFDVGNEYNPQEHKFDHHQFPQGGMREGGFRAATEPWAAFGLLWEYFGKKFNPEVHRMLDDRLVRFIDAVDNGVKMGGYSVSSAIYSFNNTEDGWRKAVDFAIQIIRNELRMIEEEIAGREIVLDAKRKGRTIILPKFTQWQEPITLREDYEGLLYVVFPSLRGGWNVQQIPPRPFASEGRKPLPEALLNSELLQEVAGEEESDSLFIHRGRFIGGASTLEGVMRIAEYAEKA